MTFDRYVELFRLRSFRWFWTGFSVSVLGDAMTRVALTWFVYETTRSAQALGWLMLCYTGPVVVGGLLAGSLLDRFNRQTVMVADNVIRGAAVALIPVLYAAGQLALWHIYAVAAVYGTLMMISLAGGPALIPALVRGDQLATANALETLSFTLGGVIGPPLAGLLIGWVGAPNVVVVDAVSYALFALILSRLAPASGPYSLPARQPADPPKEHMGHAFRLLIANKVLLATTIMFMAFNIGAGVLAVGLPIMADRDLGGGPGLYGALLGALAAGEVVSAILAGGLVLPRPLGTLICLAQLLSGMAIAILLFDRTIWLAIPSLALFGALSAPLTIWAQTLRMQIIPDHLRGRSFALLRTLMQGGSPIGGVVGGLLIPALGLPVLIGLSALIVGLPGVLGYQVVALRRAGAHATAPESQPALAPREPTMDGEQP